MDNTRELIDIRQDIDKVDRELLELFERRLKLSREVGSYKRPQCIPILDEEREKAVIENRLSLVSNKSNSVYVKQFFEHIMSISRQCQVDDMNIYLIGMSGCGKSTMLNKLADELKDFTPIDFDYQIERSQGKSIPEIFSKYGEKYFRDLEGGLLDSVAEHGRYLASTGGGIVCDELNRRVLKSSGLCIFLDRPIEHIVDEYDAGGLKSRPLIKERDDVIRIYYERMITYRELADFIVNPELHDAVQRIVEFVTSKRSTK